MEQREIFTIGYGNRKIGEFLDLLRKYEIELLVDVRSHPSTRAKYGDLEKYNQEALNDTLNREGIDYLFPRTTPRLYSKENLLGGRPRGDTDCYIDGKLNAERCEERIWYREGIALLKELACEQRVVIMCSELDPERCHRYYVISKTLTKDENFTVIHIDRAGGLISHNELERTLEAKEKPTQQSLF